MTVIKKQFQYGSRQVTLETGEVARQADGAVIVDVDGTSVLVTAVCRKGEPRTTDFFPLTVNYQERTYAAGRIPGGYFRREGRPTEQETLVSRLIDRPIRPLFPKGFYNDTQVVATVMSLNPEVPPDIPALIGASAALSLSGAPFSGPIGAARVGYIDGEYLLNPSSQQLVDSALDLVVAGTDSAVLMVESEASELSEEVMLGAVLFGHEAMQEVITQIKQMTAEANVVKLEWVAPATNDALAASMLEGFGEKVSQAYQVAAKMDRQSQLAAIRDEAIVALATEDSGLSKKEVGGAFSALEKRVVRQRVIDKQPRIDGRETTTVRPIAVRTGVLNRAHGSALFTRGETQAIVTTTLGTGRDAQLVDRLEGSVKDPFMLHYNFPPYSVGETGMVGSPKRREIGHGRLARRGLEAVLPSQEEFPYVLRVVSEITESNGSSSMASVCGASLALMDAGVPIKTPVSGIAMGLILEGDQYAILTDILGDEDHLGDMDFKVAGTATGVTALQMDIKIEGINREIMQSALEQAKVARLHILDEMNKVISEARSETSEFAPRMITFMIQSDKIRDVIGKGGSVIRALTEETGATIEIEDDGTVKISSVDRAAGEDARHRIELITADVEVGRIYEGKVVRLMDFGGFVNILPGRDGLVHISQISNERVEKVSDHLTEGDFIKVKVLEVDKQGRIRLSMKAVDAQPEQ